MVWYETTFAPLRADDWIKAYGHQKYNSSALPVQELCFTSTAVQILTLTDWSKAYGDQRTNIKIAMYNRYATAAMQELGVTVIPAFAADVC